VKQHPSLLRLYIRARFISKIPPRDFLDARRTKLFLAVEPYTMLPYCRMSGIHEAALLLEKEGVRGSFVECGVWNGGSAGILASVARGNEKRHTWLFDSWEGLPQPGEHDVNCSGRKGEKGMSAGREEVVRKLLFGKLKLDEKRIHLVRGWFDTTIPRSKEKIGEIALLHLDCDWYESVRCCLEELYDAVVPGGYIFIDDYGEWRGCQKAVDEFIEERGLKLDLTFLDYAAVWARKPRG